MPEPEFGTAPFNLLIESFYSGTTGTCVGRLIYPACCLPRIGPAGALYLKCLALAKVEAGKVVRGAALAFAASREGGGAPRWGTKDMCLRGLWSTKLGGAIEKVGQSGGRGRQVQAEGGRLEGRPLGGRRALRDGLPGLSQAPLAERTASAKPSHIGNAEPVAPSRVGHFFGTPG